MAVLDRVAVDPSRMMRSAWFWDIPAIASVRDHGVVLDPRVTVVVGENGSGKSTFVEAVAQSWRWQLNAAVHHWGPPAADEDTALHWCLDLRGERPRPNGGCFLRAEAMHTMFGSLDLDTTQLRAFGGALNTRSHGESFLAYLESRLSERGLFVLDEPEAALSFTSCLRLISILNLVCDSGSQVLLATHSPLLAAVPGALVYEFGADGITHREWAELDVVQHWQAFLTRPEQYLRHL